VKKWNQFYPFDPSKLFGLLLLLCVFAPLREMSADPLTPEHLTPDTSLHLVLAQRERTSYTQG